MFTDLPNLADHSRLEADLCIVGAGPAGLALAESFCDSRWSVILLESGSTDVRPDSQVLNEGDVLGPLHTGLTDGRCRAFGGTSRLWAGQCVPLEPSDLAPRDWIPRSGWPLDSGELARFTRDAEAFLGIGAPLYDDRLYERFTLQPPGWRADRLFTRFTVYTPQADLGRKLSSRLAASAAVRVVSDATVTGLFLDAAESRLASVTARSLGGRSCRVTARHFVLCAGTVENARILLASNTQRPAGLANGHDLVGRFYQDHPNGIVADVISEDSARLERLFRLLYRGQLRYFPKFALSPAVQRERGVLAANAHLVFRYQHDPGLAVMRELLQAGRRRTLTPRHLLQLRHLGASLGTVAGALRRRLLHGLSPTGRLERIELQAYLEQGPDPQNRVQLSRRRDKLGQFMPALTWRFGDREQATLRALVETTAAEFARLGMGKVVPRALLDAPPADWSGLIADGFHPAGTTRMGAQARDGVVDRDLRAFDVANLYVCGASVFPTSGFANPTLTIVALALRLATYLKAELLKPAGGIVQDCASGVKEPA